MFLKTRLTLLEEKAGVKKANLVLVLIRRGKVKGARRTKIGGSREDLKHLIGLSLEKAQEPLKQYEERGDRIYIFDSCLDPQFEKDSKGVVKKAGPEKQISEIEVPEEIPVIKEERASKPKRAGTWKQDRKTWAESLKERPTRNVPLNEFMNMLDGLTPQGFDKNGRKTGPVDSGRPTNWIN